MGDDLTPVNAARVSFNKTSEWEWYGMFDEAPPDAVWDAEKRMHKRLSDKDQKLINYLATHAHWSPFAHAQACFRVKAPIFVARQLVKHQVGGVWNEVSRRYVDDEPEFFLPDSWRARAENVKQGSSQSQFIDVFEYGDDYTANIPEDAVEICLEAYKRLLHKGVAPEQARMVLPQNTMTEWWWTGSLMFWARVCKQRLDAHAQAETQEIAQMINKHMEGLFPHSWKALMGG